MNNENVYTNPLAPRALEIAKERDRLAAENAALRAALALIVDGTHLQRQQWCARNGGEPEIACESAQASMVRVARAALAATAPAAPGEPQP